MFLNGCLSATPTITPGPLATPTVTPLPTNTPTPQPIGHPTNPLYLGVVVFAPDSPSIVSSQELASQLGDQTNLSIQVKTFPSYQVMLNQMAERQVHIAWLPPLTYLYASQLGIAQVAMLTNHFGVYQYGTQYLANTASGFTPYFDPVSGFNSVDAVTALSQFAGMRPCWVDPGSAAGFIVPAGILAANNIEVAEAAYTQTHAALVRTLYVRGVCDFGATFSISGDPRTASAVMADLPDAIERIPVIYRSDAIIPNLNISYIAGIDEETEKLLTTAFSHIASDDAGLLLLSAAAGDYQIEALKPVDDTLYDPLRLAVNALNLNRQDLIGK